MNELHQSASPELDWEQLHPVLDDAMHALDDEDREAVLLRFFERRPLAEIGERFGITDNAARMRVERALEKLRTALVKLGLTSTAVALAALLTDRAVAASPAGLALKVSAVSRAAGATAVAGGLAVLMTGVKAKLLLSVVIATAIALPLVWKSQAARRNDQKSSVRIAPPVNPSSVPLPTQISALAVSPSALTNHITSPVTNASLTITLSLTDALTGKPVRGVPIDYRGWVKGKFTGLKLRADREGVCVVNYPEGTTQLELTTRIDGHADTRLLWRPDHGESIPATYQLHLDRAVPIAGRVVDAQGQPVSGAKVGWNHEEDTALKTGPESHEFSWIEVKTDRDGHWQINRIAADMIRRLYGHASHSDYVDAPMIFTHQSADAETQLREGTHVFHLATAVTLQGTVIDDQGQPVANASVQCGLTAYTGTRTTKTLADGTFTLSGCKPGKELVSAESPGFSSTTMEVDVNADTPPLKLKLQRGKILRLLVTNRAGDPVRRANVWLDTNDNRYRNSSDKPQVPIQASFDAKTDVDGRVIWSNAPNAELTFDIVASGYMRASGIKIRPDGEEHVIIMDPALVISGQVQDESGAPIPRFRVGLGWPQWNPITEKTNAQWNSIARYWIDFVGGQYRESIEEPVIYGTKNPGYVLKFEAEGFAPFVSRALAPEEGQVQLDVTLRRASAVLVTVLNQAGQPVADADVGLVSSGAHLYLTPTGFSRQSGGNAHRTDLQGRFSLPPDDNITQVIVACAVGYAEATPTVLRKSSTLVLQSWGQLEVTCVSGGQPVAGRSYFLQLANGDFESVSTDFTAYRGESDAQGKFTIRSAPPGKQKLVRLLPTVQPDGVTSYQHDKATDIEILPGKTTSITLGSSNYRVRAQINWPGGVRRSEWQLMATLGTPFPTIPKEVSENPELRKQYTRTPGFQAALKARSSYPAQVQNDGQLIVEDVAPGSYQLSVAIYTIPSGTQQGIIVGNYVAEVTIPADPPTGQLDLGAIELRPPPKP